MSDDRKTSQQDKKPQNNERAEKSYTTSHLDDKLTGAGKGGSGNGGKNSRESKDDD